VVGPNRAHQVQVSGAAYACDFSPERFGKLHGKRPHPTRRAIHHNPLPGSDLARITQPLESGDSGDRDGGRFLKRTIRGFQGYSVFTSTGVLGEATHAAPKYLIPRLKLGDVLANGFHPPGDIRAQSPAFGDAHQPTGYTSRSTSHAMIVQRICGCRMNLDQYLIVVGGRFCHLGELKHLRSSVFCEHNRFHEFPPGSGVFESPFFPLNYTFHVQGAYPQQGMDV
jgi:hypothetical protein